ncbi:hypothetical protein ALC62_06010 [Cyphomyrmex costatus]|uniref:Uncharacterized protein n=1 Tax=Cyphomyrmex costatus TaxID=456900 RepID=A0A195CQX9_9HYME|nr:hypothetical protein ALC62_06010 [Cyphomyrmex costatus]
MPMLINYSLTNAAPPRDCNYRRVIAFTSHLEKTTHKEERRNCDVEAEVSELETSKDRGRFKGLRVRSTRPKYTTSSQTASPSTESCLSSQSYRGMGPYNLHFGLRARNLGVTSAAETLIHQLEESKEEEKEEVQNEVDEDSRHIASKSLASELISLVLGHVDVDVTTNERERYKQRERERERERANG